MSGSYRLLTYAADSGPRPGLLVGDRVFDLESLKPAFAAGSVKEVLQNWEAARPALKALAEKLSAGSVPGARSRPLADARLLAPILYPGGLFCATANYTDHMYEMRKADPPPKGATRPCFFLKTTEHSIIGSGETAHLRAAQSQVFWEGELGAVIGRTARNVSRAAALGCVAGYTIVNDLSDATDQAARRGDMYGQWFGFDWFRTKCWDTAAPMGPWITPADEVPDPQDLSIRTVTKGETFQNSSTRNMFFTVAEQIEYLSERVTLRPGDVISTGTCAGVGRPRGIFLQDGDEVAVTIGKLGTLRTPIVRDKT
jgi:2-keto-4-pentenoate hydratase/2-oxohepta-3-ene-1,7-dioic acid hydratase in catechol pathway